MKRFFGIDLIGENTHDLVVFLGERDIREVVRVSFHEVVDVAIAHNLVKVFIFYGF
jgi:hypothetical protein